MRHLLEGSVYFIQLLLHGQRLLEGGIYWRAEFIGINTALNFAILPRIDIRGVIIWQKYYFVVAVCCFHKTWEWLSCCVHNCACAMRLYAFANRQITRVDSIDSF